MSKNNINESQPLISVIVPVYNVQKYLLRCVNSILDQTYKQKVQTKHRHLQLMNSME